MITWLRRLFPSNRFARNVSVLIAGTVFGQAIMLLATPILTRVYGPEAFGSLGVFTSIVALLQVGATLQFHLAIPLPQNDSRAAKVAVLSFLVLVIFVIAIVLLLLVFGDQIFTALSLDSIQRYAWLLPVTLLLSSSYDIVSYWAVRNKDFDTIAGTRIVQSAASVIAQVSLSFLGSVGLVVGHVVSRATGLSRLGLQFLRSLRELRQFLRGVPGSLVEVGKEYKQFPIYSTWNSFLNTAGRQLPAVILTGFFGPASAGVYYLANRVLLTPISLIAQATGKVFIANAPEAERRGELGLLIAAIQAQLVRVYCLPLGVFLLIAPELFRTVFGEEWADAGRMAQVLVPWLFLVGLTNPVSNVVGLLNRQDVALVFEILLAVARLGGLVLGSLSGSVVMAVGMFSAGATIGVFLKWVWLMHIAGANFRPIVYPLLRESGLVAGAVLAGFVIREFALSYVFWAYTLILAALAVYLSSSALLGGLSIGESSPDRGHKS